MLLIIRFLFQLCLITAVLTLALSTPSQSDCELQIAVKETKSGTVSQSPGGDRVGGVGWYNSHPNGRIVEQWPHLGSMPGAAQIGGWGAGEESCQLLSADSVPKVSLFCSRFLSYQGA